MCAELISYEQIADPDKPYKVTTAEQLVEVFDFYDYCIYETGDIHPQYEPLNISLEADIDMSGLEILPIQTDMAAWIMIEGNGHTIKNLTFEAYKGGVYSGFFSSLFNGSYIRNVNFENINATLPSKTSGVLVGYVNGKVEISNCSISGSVTYTHTSPDYLGGAIGAIGTAVGPVIKNITVDLDYNLPIQLKSFGGVIGYVNSTSLDLVKLENRSKKVLDINKVTSGVGGICGWIFLSTGIRVLDCANFMDIESSSPMVGGIVGRYSNPPLSHLINELSNCSNSGSINSLFGAVGGIVGLSENVKIGSSVNIGDIYSYSPSYSVDKEKAGVGGIVGTYNVTSVTTLNNTLTSCINMGYVSSEVEGNTAGIVGYYFSNENNYNETEFDRGSMIHPFFNCLSLSSDNSNRIVKDFLFNTNPDYNCFGGLYADLSLGESSKNDSVHYVTNSVLTSGKMPFYYYSINTEEGYYYDNETALSKNLDPAFLQKPGYYPYLNLDNEIAKLASLPILVADGERLDSIVSGFTCGMTDGVVWQSEKGTFSISEDGAATILNAGEDVIYGILGDAVISRHIKVYKNIFGGGNGTVDNPYLLRSVAHLEELRDSLATEEGWSKNKYFKIAAHISGLDFPLSATKETRFMGNLDGNGYTIKMNIKESTSDAALFVIAENANIHDLQTSGSVTGKDLAGGVCAAAYNCNIYNCFNSAKISGDIAAGVVAYSDGGNAYGLCNSGSIVGSSIAGGVIGKFTDIDNTTRISDLVNSGFVKGYEVAGLIGDAEKISASYSFNRLINYGSVYGTSEGNPYILTSQFSGFSFADCYYDIQITRNGKCETAGLKGAEIGVEIMPTTATDIVYEVFPADDNAVYIPSFVIDMRNSELLGIIPTFENEELTSFVQTSPSLLTSAKLVLRKLDGEEEYTKLSDLVSYTDVPAILAQKTGTGDERETYITIAAIPFRSGDGSADDPYLISNLDELNSLASLIKANKVTDKYYVTSKDNNWSYNKHFKLTADIQGDGTASSIVTEPISSVETPFQGFFDGDGHTIKVSINNQDGDYQALFGCIESGAVIENLIVSGVVNGMMCVSGVVGLASSKKEGELPIIRNVINNAEVTTSSGYSGGICGRSAAKIEGCVNTAFITFAPKTNPFYIGGIVGITSADLVRCYNIGNINGTRRVGGICGSALSETVKGVIKECINYGMVYSNCTPSADFVYIGGIAGSSDNFELETLLNLNRVVCDNTIYVDAIVGKSTHDVKNSYYDKQVTEKSSIYGSGLLTDEISSMSFDAFNSNAGMYPTLNMSLDDGKISKLASSSIQLFVNEDKTVFDNVSKVMNYGDVKVANSDIKLTSKNGVVKVEKGGDGYTVKPVAVGKDTLTATYGTYSKQISVDVYCIPVQVDTVITGCQLVTVKKSDGTEIICKNDTVFTEVYPRENSNCDSTIKYTVKIQKLKPYLIDTVLCGKDDVAGAAYRGNNYTNKDYITRYDTVGCDSAITTKLRVVIPRVDSVYSNSGCDSAFCEIDGKYYYKTVSFFDTIKSKSCNCDSVIIKVNMNVTNSDGYEFDEVYLDSFTVGKKTLKGGESLTIYDTLVTKNGCDSIVKKNIYVYDRVFKLDTVLYVCDYYLDNVNFKKITKDTVLVEQLSETLHGINVEGYYLQKRDIRISHNTSADTTRIPDEYYCERYMLTQNVDGVDKVIGFITKDTVVYTNIPRDKKCDSVLVRSIHIMPAPVKDTFEVVNCGDYYDATLDTTFTSTQDYYIHKKFNNSKCDCDSSISLRRYKIRTTENNNINISGCSEAQYTFYGSVSPTVFTSSVDTVEVIRYTSGPVCDSIINNIHIVVANPIYDTVSRSTCGDTIMYNGKVYLASDGDYKETITYSSIAGCDSLIRYLDFRFVETIENILPTRYGCDSVVCDINNKVYYDDHKVSVEVGTTEQGCPIFNTQSVVVLHPTTTNLEIMGCEFAEFNDEIFYSDTVVKLSLKSTLCDCDSFVNVKIVVLPRIESPTIYLAECDSVMINDPENGVVVIKEDVDDYQCMYQKVYNVAGKDYICDSIVHYNVHVKKPTYNSVVYTGESMVVYGGNTYHRSQVIRDTLVNAEGCDSFVEIKIVVEKDLGYPVIVDKFGYTLFCNNNIGKVKFATYQWYKDGAAIPGATKEYYEGAKGEKLNGCYYVEVTSNEGREFVSETYCVDKERELKIYPNPVSEDEILTIDYPFTEDEKKNLRVEVYDAMGILVNEFVPTAYPIQMEMTLPSGHYFVLIYESDERMLDTRFIVR